MFGDTEKDVGLSIRRVTVLESVEQQEKDLAVRLEKVKRVKELLSRHPEIQELLTLVREVGL